MLITESAPETAQPILERYAGLMRLEGARRVLLWDQETVMPKSGAEARAQATGELAGLIVERWIDPGFGEELARVGDADLDPRLARVVREIQRQYDRQAQVPKELAQEYSRTTSRARVYWRDAREENDFAKFQPELEKIVSLSREFGAIYARDGETPYEGLLGDYDPGLRTDEVDRAFETVIPRLRALVEQYASRSAAQTDEFLRGPFPVEAQRELVTEVVEILGYPLDQGQLAVSTHPFCLGVASPHDVRMTTRYDESFFPTAFFGALHETGHCLYELGFDPELVGTPGASAVSMSLHESQSRLWENIVGRAEPFWHFCYPKLRAQFPAFDSVDRGDFLRAINRVEPSLIRVEADEVTYSLHIALRYELERDLIAGAVEVADLPELWNAKTESYLGLTPPTNREGVLQDIHWSMGAFGYFPTYFLGNLYAGQFYQAALRDLPELEAGFREGEFAPLLEWLREHVHTKGSIYSADEILRESTGETMNPEATVDLLEAKLARVWGEA